MKRIVVYIAISGLLVASLRAQEAPEVKGVCVSDVTATQAGDGGLTLQFDVDYGGLSVPTSKARVLTPVLFSKDSTRNKRLLAVAVMGKNRYRITRRRSQLRDVEMRYYCKTIEHRKKGGDSIFHYSATIPFEEWMYGGHIDVYHELVGCADCSEMLGKERLTAIAEKPVPVEPKIERPNLVMIPPLKTEKTRMIRKDAYLNFQVGKSEVLPTYMNNATELDKIYNSIDSIYGDKEYRINTIRLAGYASPDGRNEANIKLSEARAGGLKKHLGFKYDIEAAKIKVASEGENWKGLIEWIKANEPSYAEGVMDIIHSVGNEDQRELRIRQKFPAAYRELYRDVYPGLRKVEYQIDYVIIPFSVEEGRQKVWIEPAKMSPYELYQVAVSYGIGSEEYNRIILLTPVLYPDDKVAVNNAVLVAYDTGDYASMYQYLRKLERMK